MKSKSEALKIKNTPAPPDTSGAHCLGTGNVWVWGLDALQPAPGDSEGVPAGVSPPFRLGIAFSTDAGGSLGDPRVPARSHRDFFWGGGAGGEDGDTRREKKILSIGEKSSPAAYFGGGGGVGYVPHSSVPHRSQPFAVSSIIF